MTGSAGCMRCTLREVYKENHGGMKRDHEGVCLEVGATGD